ncbi:pyridoxal phosphate-dependent aminotransferase [Halalkalibacterium halodurans]|uniref:pyridoxal phosphate-dependent aminotransferase n=1 Tax=Halalkalibacterium halodurans TaxID=86665 RepID=UPI002AAA0F37|nr:pyridoxal phosphate-dependent aminotransferase [Halalkalibacterium halodurans]MDY7221593.1 pyridoxal phosphate-dependent aminotransferase [Halalkalibacterium halodurans]MDY7240869.1 pyridoxal phosphate-dependent aminotransferase [Halalkalibacterium halodurans]
MKTFEQAKMMKRLPEQFFAKLVEQVQEVKKDHDDIINLGQGSPDLPTPEHIVEKLQEAAENPLYHRYAPFSGYPFLKEAVSKYYEREYGVSVDPKTEVAVLGGAKTGLVEVSQCFLNPGDMALVPDPGYPDYWSGIAIAGGSMYGMPLKKELGFHPDLRGIPAPVLYEAKLMFLNYPNNPTGAVATEELFAEAIELAEEYDICVVHDFAYSAIGFDGQKPLSFLQVEGAKNVGVEMITMSKNYNMAGWRIGFAVGNPSVIKAIETLQDHYFCSLFGGIQAAAAHALLSDQSNVTTLVQTYEERRNALVKAARAIGWDVEAPKGSFFAWFPVPSGFTSEEFATYLLKKARVVVAPGKGFGEHGEGYVRVALLADIAKLEEAMGRVGKLDVFSNKRG